MIILQKSFVRLLFVILVLIIHQNNATADHFLILDLLH
jgi:hypothetical protein